MTQPQPNQPQQPTACRCSICGSFADYTIGDLHYCVNCFQGQTFASRRGSAAASEPACDPEADTDEYEEQA